MWRGAPPRRGRHGAPGNPRPQRRDPRHRREAAVAVRRAAAHLSTCDDDIELLTSVMPDLDTTRAAPAARAASAASPGSSARSRHSSRRWSSGSASRGSASSPRTSESIRTASEVSHELGYVNVENTGVAGIESWLDAQGPRPTCIARASRPTASRSRWCSLDLRVQHVLRDELIAAKDKFKAKAAAGHHLRGAHRRGDRHGVAARLRPRTAARGRGLAHNGPGTWARRTA